MIKLIVEERNIKDSIPSAVSQLFKHLLNCIYQPKLHHKSWEQSIQKQVNYLQKEIKHYSYKRVKNIIEDTIDLSYKYAVIEFFKEMEKSIQCGTPNPYSLTDMKTLIPNSYKDMGNDTIYSDINFNAETLLNLDIMQKCIKRFHRNSENFYDK